MEVSFIYVGYSGAVLVALVVLYLYEDRQGRRVVLPGLRARLDALCEYGARGLMRTRSLFGYQVISLILHYLAHNFLKRILSMLHRLEERIDTLVHKNKKAVQTMNEERSRTHLDEIAQHKHESALTESQKRKMRQH